MFNNSNLFLFLLLLLALLLAFGRIYLLRKPPIAMPSSPAPPLQKIPTKVFVSTPRTIMPLPAAALGTTNLHDDVPRVLAEGLIKAAAQWDHPSGKFVRAPKHCKNIRASQRHGWVLDLGVNSFLISKAILRCQQAIAENKDKSVLMHIITGCVSNVNDHEIPYPQRDGRLIFGTQAIHVELATEFILQHPLK